MLLLVGGIAASLAVGQDQAAARPNLNAVLRASVDKDLAIRCRFDLSGTADQSFQNTEYRYAVLDKDGVQVDRALTFRLPIRRISLPKHEQSVIDTTDAVIERKQLKFGEDYYLVVSIRNLTGLAKFKGR
jgi:hypothetical protein